MRDPLAQFQSLAVERAGLLFFKPADLIMIVGDLERSDVSILGLDAFIITGEMTQPVMEHSVDFSKTNHVWDAAKTFLETRIHLGLMFEIILGD